MELLLALAKNSDQLIELDEFVDLGEVYVQLVHLLLVEEVELLEHECVVVEVDVVADDVVHSFYSFSFFSRNIT